MKSKIFCVYDSKVEAYLNPFYMATKGQAIRAITDTLADDNHQFSRHPEDFTLFELGEYDDSTGCMVMHDSKISLGNMLEFKGGSPNISLAKKSG